LELSTINTPQDLVELNNEPTPPSVSRLDSLIEDMDLNETYELTLRLLQNLGTFHQSVIETMKEEGDCDRLVVWVQDEQKLHTCHDLLHEVYDSE
jgi:hypothetical protein